MEEGRERGREKEEGGEGGKERERKRMFSGIPSYKDMDPVGLGPHP